MFSGWWVLSAVPLSLDVVSTAALLLLLVVSCRALESAMAGSWPRGFRAVMLAFLAVVTAGSAMQARDLPNAGRWQYLDRTARILEQHAPRKFAYQLASTVDPLFPAIVATDARWAGRYNELGLWLSSYSSRDPRAGPHDRPGGMGPEERQVFEAVVADLADHPPSVLIVETSPCRHHMGCGHFDFIEYFGQDARFRDLMAPLRVIERLTTERGSTYAVFVRD